MKKIALLFVALLILQLPIQAEQMQPVNPQTPLYTALLRYSSSIFKTEALEESVGYLAKGKRVDIYQVTPSRLLIGRDGKVLGYINRDKLDDYTVKNLQPSNIPNYPGVQNIAIVYVKEPVSVREAPNESSNSLIELTPGCRLALIGFQDGWGKLIFKKQYGYVDSRKLENRIPVDYVLQDTSGEYPIAAYTSFYNIATNEDNLSRIKNLEVSCDKFESIVLNPGERFDFNKLLGPYNARSGYHPAIVLVDGGSKLGYGGGTCQISSTLYNVILQLPGIQIDHRRPHGPSGASYLPHGADAAVGNKTQNLIFTNNYNFPVRIDGTVQDGALTIAIWRY
ncbi:MAG: VanW family protein [Eubacteriales bacterium]|nr:VanW family protein [Eubacteriales bacterium]